MLHKEEAKVEAMEEAKGEAKVEEKEEGGEVPHKEEAKVEAIEEAKKANNNSSNNPMQVTNLTSNATIAVNLGTMRKNVD